jgi:DNA (cytosine-5)-methyltransferase 1
MNNDNDSIKIGTLFSGIGAPEMALKLKKIPHSIEFACDNDPFVKETYISNHDCKVFYNDIKEIKKAPPIDLLIFGFPCQPFSVAGKRGGMLDERGRLVLKAMNVLKQCRPSAFIAENVEHLVTMQNGKILNSLLRRMRRLGYKTQHAVINAKDCGLPQNRRRLWIVGTQHGKFNFSNKKIPYKPLSTLLDNITNNEFFATKEFLNKPKVKKRLANYNSDYINCITQTISRNGSSSEYIGYVAAVFNAIGQARKPTVDECCRLFGIPDDFAFPESVCKTRRYAMLANSMAVPVVEHVLEDLLCR